MLAAVGDSSDPCAPVPAPSPTRSLAGLLAGTGAGAGTGVEISVGVGVVTGAPVAYLGGGETFVYIGLLFRNYRPIGPNSCSPLIACFIRFVLVGNIRDEWVIRVRIRQE